MTAINHALTGAIIGIVVGQPFVALPAALVSHFICDALPHFGSNIAPAKSVNRFNLRRFENYLLVEASLCFLLVVCLAIFRPQHWFTASICAFLATSPDLLWIRKYLAMRHNRPWKGNLYERFADYIQWFQKPIGAVVEVAWFAAAIVLLIPFFR